MTRPAELLAERDEHPTRLFLLGRARDMLTEDDLAVLDASVAGERSYASRRTLVRMGEPVQESTLLLEGFICRYMDDRAGYRQLVSIHVPGDFIDLHGFPLGRLDHDLATIGPVRVANWTHEALVETMRGREGLTRALWLSTLLDAAMHREWIFRLGRLNAEGRVAHFICELDARLAMVGLNPDHRFALPLKQADIAEACGLTGVHVNRVLRGLREAGTMVFKAGRVDILDHARLAAIGEFDPAYLYGVGTRFREA